jgi:hypothetical protein
MKPLKISPCPSCRSATGPGILEAIPLGPGVRHHHYQVGCVCGARGPRAVTVRRAIEVWNEMETP